MMLSLMRLPTTAALLAAAAGTFLMSSGLPQNAAGAAPEVYPVPTNLKVLPRELTGAQVHEVMEQWKLQLSMDCNACHAEDKKKSDADGQVVLNFADDSKPEKVTARLMYTMTEEINTRYIAKIDSSGVPVTCGTCHRGHVGPEPMLFPSPQSNPPTAGAADAAKSAPRQ